MSIGLATKFISVGFGNYVAVQRVINVSSPESAPIKRLVQDARDAGSVIDVSCGKKTKSVIVTDSRHIILSALSTDVIASRLCGEDDAPEGEQHHEKDREDDMG